MHPDDMAGGDGQPDDPDRRAADAVNGLLGRERGTPAGDDAEAELSAAAKAVEGAAAKLEKVADAAVQQQRENVTRAAGGAEKRTYTATVKHRDGRTSAMDMEGHSKDDIREGLKQIGAKVLEVKEKKPTAPLPAAPTNPTPGSNTGTPVQPNPSAAANPPPQPARDDLTRQMAEGIRRLVELAEKSAAGVKDVAPPHTNKGDRARLAWEKARPDPPPVTLPSMLDRAAERLPAPFRHQAEQLGRRFGKTGVGRVARRVVVGLRRTKAGRAAVWFTGRMIGSAVGRGAGAVGGRVAGAGVGAAIGSVVPGAGTAIGMAVGVVIGAVVEKTIGRVVSAIHDGTKQQLQLFRHLGESSPSMALVLAQRDVREFQRDLAKGERLSGSASRLVDSEQRFKDSTRNTEELLTKIKDGGLAVGLDLLSSLNERLDKLSEALLPILDEILKKLGLNNGNGNAPTFGQLLEMMKNETEDAKRKGDDFFRRLPPDRDRRW